MIVLYPVLLAGAILILGRARQFRPEAVGPRWFLASALAGWLLAFSFVTGLSIGLLVLPFAAVVLFAVAAAAPAPAETLGFVAGVGLVGVVVLVFGGSEQLAWGAVGGALTLAAAAGYAVALRRR